MKRTPVLAGVVIMVLTSNAFAGVWFEETRPDQDAAMKAVTDIARASASRKQTCFKPAWAKEVKAARPCVAVTGGVQCSATVASRNGSCNNGNGWLRPGSRADGFSLPPMVPIYPDLPTSLPKPPERKPCRADDPYSGPCM